MADGASPSIPVSTDNRLRNLREAAMFLHTGESTLRQKLYEGRGPVAIKLPGSNRWRFRPSDLEAYVKGGEISPAAEAEAEAKSGKTDSPNGEGPRPRPAGDGLANEPQAKALDVNGRTIIVTESIKTQVEQAKPWKSVRQRIEKANKARVGKPAGAPSNQS
jgi:hypothetical protein